MSFLLFEKAISDWRSVKQPQPKCDEHQKPAKMRIVKDVMKVSYGRPLFCVFLCEHIPLSISICSNVPGYDH